jgi:hypothetical protein
LSALVEEEEEDLLRLLGLLGAVEVEVAVPALYEHDFLFIFCRIRYTCIYLKGELAEPLALLAGWERDRL